MLPSDSQAAPSRSDSCNLNSWPCIQGFISFVQPILGTGFTLKVKKLIIREVKPVAQVTQIFRIHGFKVQVVSPDTSPSHVESREGRGEANGPDAELSLQDGKAGSGDGHKTGINFLALWTFLRNGAGEGDRGRGEPAWS